ncbi:MAG: hypothetical protein M1376_21670 [Planctomycetes bacterium]|nr:hypothetical protein [Planctomycetota bacterium]
MTCQTEQGGTERTYQPFPPAMEFGGNLNIPLTRLHDCIAGQARVYCYVITSMRKRDGEFVQIGCGPNFEGGLITLCTCKHRMRTFLDPRQWNGIWIAGFTSSPTGDGKNFLIYLMRVAHAFASQRDLWFSTAIPSTVKQTKAAHRNPLGDLYRPRSQEIDPWDPNGYVPPCPNHRHTEGWATDINYRGVGARRAALLVGDPHQSFLWNRPMISYAGRLHRGQKKEDKLGDLLAQLKAGEAS